VEIIKKSEINSVYITAVGLRIVDLFLWPHNPDHFVDHIHNQSYRMGNKTSSLLKRFRPGGFGFKKRYNNDTPTSSSQKDIEALQKPVEDGIDEIEKKVQLKDDEIQSLKNRLEHASKQTQELTQAEQKILTLESTVRSLQDLLKERDGTVSNLQQDLSSGTKRVENVEKQLEVRAQELSESRMQLGKLKFQLEARTKELDGVETFVIKADQHAHSDVKDRLNSLNTEILSLAATIAEAYQFPQRVSAKGVGASPTELTVLVGQITHHEDPTIVQYAMQSVICFYVCWAARSWCHKKSDSELLGRLYESVRARGEFDFVLVSVS
jgi:prefoldin subunit 5